MRFAERNRKIKNLKNLKEKHTYKFKKYEISATMSEHLVTAYQMDRRICIKIHHLLYI